MVHNYRAFSYWLWTIHFSSVDYKRFDMKKKTKFNFSISNYGEEIPKKVVKIQNMVKGLMLLLTSATFIASSEKYTLACAIAGYIINEIICCVGVEENNEFVGL